MTSPGGKDRHGFVSVTEPVLAHPQHIPGRSHEKRVLSRGRAFYPVQVVLLATIYFGAAKLGLTMAFVAEQGTGVGPPTGIARAALPWRREHFGKLCRPGCPALVTFYASSTEGRNGP